MALITCPECRKEISDKAQICVGCGFPIKEFLESNVVPKKVETPMVCGCCGSDDIDDEGYCNACGMKLLKAKKEQEGSRELPAEATVVYTICPQCDFHNEPGKFTCIKCGHKYTVSEYNVIYAREEKNPSCRLCPSCNSTRTRAFTEEKVILPRKTKVQTSLNLNPFKPFTLFDHKEKVVREGFKVDISKFICDDCGKIFK